MLAAKALAAAVSQEPAYIEDVFSTWLYTGTGASQTITNGIDLAGDGGLVWIKDRTAAQGGRIQDTVRGASANLIPSGTNGSQSLGSVSSFNSSGFSLSSSDPNTNTNGNNFVSWTFRKQPKFFDVVTYTGTGANTTVAHNLGSVPGCIIVKRTDTTSDWQVYHRANTANPETDYLVLNSTAATVDSDTRWNDTLPTSTVFSLGTDTTVNASGGTYVAYLFAHDAGGFGLSGSDNVISCGSFTTNGSGQATVSLGYEPQWLLFKQTNGADNWREFDTMRGWSMTQNNFLFPNTSGAETASSGSGNPTATGFTIDSANASATYIYIAIRRGPMKVPTNGTSVYTPVTWTATAAPATVTGFNFPVDLIWHGQRAAVYGSGITSWDRLRGAKARLYTSLADAESTRNGVTAFDQMTSVGVSDPSAVGEVNYDVGNTEIFWGMRRAPGFFDVVCAAVTSGVRTYTHGLGAAPELLICKRRGGVEDWITFRPNVTGYLVLNTNAALGVAISATSTASTFTLPSGSVDYADNYVFYLFATVAGVSKVGSYTGTGTTKQIDCGFTAGARFVLIKRTDSTGDWYVWDSARGIVAGNDPYLLLNSTAAEVTGTDYVDTYSAGFELSSTAPAAINANGGTFIFLAIA